MPWYLVERTAAEPLCLADLERDHAGDGVTWLHSYLGANRRRSFCLYEAPTPAAVRQAAQRNGLPIDRITEVSLVAPPPVAAWPGSNK